MWQSGRFIPDYSMFDFSEEDVQEFNIAEKENYENNREYREYMRHFYKELRNMNYNTEYPF